MDEHPMLIETLKAKFPDFTFRSEETSIVATRGGVRLQIQLEPPSRAEWSPINKWGCKAIGPGVVASDVYDSSDPSGLAIFVMGQAVAALRRAADQPLLDRLNDVASRFAVGLTSTGLAFDWRDVSSHSNPPHSLLGEFDIEGSDNNFKIELTSTKPGEWVCQVSTAYWDFEVDDDKISSILGRAKSANPIDAFLKAIDIAFRATKGAANVFRGLALGLRTRGVTEQYEIVRQAQDLSGEAITLAELSRKVITLTELIRHLKSADPKKKVANGFREFYSFSIKRNRRHGTIIFCPTSRTTIGEMLFEATALFERFPIGAGFPVFIDDHSEPGKADAVSLSMILDWIGASDD